MISLTEWHPPWQLDPGLNLNRHFEGFVDAYFGPPELKAEVETAQPRSLEALATMPNNSCRLSSPAITPRRDASRGRSRLWYQPATSALGRTDLGCRGGREHARLPPAPPMLVQSWERDE
jgi:hypothetical protein